MFLRFLYSSGYDLKGIGDSNAVRVNNLTFIRAHQEAKQEAY